MNACCSLEVYKFHAIIENLFLTVKLYELNLYFFVLSTDPAKNLIIEDGKVQNKPIL